MLAVLGGDDPAVTRDQEVRRKPEPASGLLRRRKVLPTARDLPAAAQDRPQDGPPGARVEQRARRRLQMRETARQARDVGPDQEFLGGLAVLLRGLGA